MPSTRERWKTKKIISFYVIDLPENIHRGIRFHKCTKSLLAQSERTNRTRKWIGLNEHATFIRCECVYTARPAIRQSKNIVSQMIDCEPKSTDIMILFVRSFPLSFRIFGHFRTVFFHMNFVSILLGVIWPWKVFFVLFYHVIWSRCDDTKRAKIDKAKESSQNDMKFIFVINETKAREKKTPFRCSRFSPVWH